MISTSRTGRDTLSPLLKQARVTPVGDYAVVTYSDIDRVAAALKQALRTARRLRVVVIREK